jgi:hypothetical protein
MLASITGLVIPLAKYKWGEEQQDQDTLLAFTDSEIEFHVYTDAFNKQLGATIMQERRPLVFYIRNLSSTQTHYTTREQELLRPV